MDLLINLIAFSLLLAFLLNFFKLWRRSKAAQKQPPSPWKLPIIGHLHHLAGAPPHQALTKLSRKHGPLMRLNLGEIPTIVVSSPRLAKEVLRTHDVAFANRPRMLFGEILCYNFVDILFSPYGEHWRQMRKISSLELLSSKSVKSFGSVRLDEASHLITSIKSQVDRGETINLSQKLGQYTSSMVQRAAFGKISEGDLIEFQEVTRELFPLLSNFEFSDLFPSLKILHPLFSMRSKFERLHRRLDRVLDRIIDQHVDGFERSKTTPRGSSDEDFIDVLLRVQENSEFQLQITKDRIKALLFDMSVAGTQTSTATTGWAMAEMIRNPHVMTKAQSEIREAFSGKKTIEEVDIQEMRYLNCVIKESMRLHTPGPLLLPRECREQCEIDGYVIPVKTRVLVNAWANGRDPEYWDDPESFKPERFENSDVDFTGSHFEYLPFGAGRRVCPGISFGLANVELPLALLLYHFDWGLPNGLKPNELDMSETFGLALSRANPLLLLAKLYHPSLEK